jgi:uncharacterized protein (DUF1786 family)
MRTNPPSGDHIDARLSLLRRSVLRTISRRQKKTRIALVAVAVGGVSLGGVGAAVALSETFVTAEVLVTPAAASSVAECLVDREWDAHVLSREESIKTYEPGDALVVRIRVSDTNLGAVGREVESCRIEVQANIGESTLPASLGAPSGQDKSGE